MTNEEKKTMIKRYIASYNRFDIDGMVTLVHPEVVFKNVVGDEVNAEAAGVSRFREMALQSKDLFSSRDQKATNFKFRGNVGTVDIAYEGVLTVDLPNGMKAGEVLRLKGRSEFEFKDGKICFMNDLLRPRIWASFRASSGPAPCDVLLKYASDAKPCDCPVAYPSSRSRDSNS